VGVDMSQPYYFGGKIAIQEKVSEIRWREKHSGRKTMEFLRFSGGSHVWGVKRMALAGWKGQMSPRKTRVAADPNRDGEKRRNEKSRDRCGGQTRARCLPGLHEEEGSMGY